MKSTYQSLVKRGYSNTQIEERCNKLDEASLEKMLGSSTPQERTSAARVLGRRKHTASIQALSIALENEKSLYSKIAISEALGSMGIKAVPYLIGMLGKIGRNQYKQMPNELFKKTNYPLPRDIAARTIIKIGPPALPALEEILIRGELWQIYEAIDSIGYISFYSHEQRSLKHLFKCLKQHDDDELLTWKIIRALEAFPLPKSKKFLQTFLVSSKNKMLTLEAARSLKQISKNKCD